jgi:hypothetical protein
VAEYFRVSPRIWLEPYSDDVRTLAFFLLTCRHREVAGIYLLPLAYAAEDLRWEMGRLKSALEFLIADEFCSYDEDSRVVFIHKALSYQAPANPKQEKHCLNTIDELPPTPLLGEFLKAAQTLCTEGYAKTFADHITEHLNGTPNIPLDIQLSIPLGKPLPEQSGKRYGISTTTTTATEKELSEKRTSKSVDNSFEADFDEWWGSSGKVGSRADAKVLYIHWRTVGGASKADLLSAITNYHRRCTDDGSWEQHGRTFLAKRDREGHNINRWSEWLDPTAHAPARGNGKPIVPRRPQCECGCDLTPDESGSLSCPECSVRDSA